MKDFIKYFNVIVHAPKPKSVPVGTIVAITVLCILNILAVGDGSCWFAFYALFIFAAAIAVFQCCCESPNMEAAFPANHRKKLAYRFLTPFILFLIVTAVMFTVILMVYVIRWMFETHFRFDFDVFVKEMFKALGVYGGLFGLAYLIIMYSAGMITGFIKRRKNRNIFLACFCISEFICYLIMGVHYNNFDDAYSGPRLPFSTHYYASMNRPWLLIVFCFLVAAGMLGIAIYLGVKHYDPKKF